MKSEAVWLRQLGRQADLDFSDGGSDFEISVDVAGVRARHNQKSVNMTIGLMTVVLISLALSAWYSYKLDFEMSRTSWPAYTQYQQFQLGGR